MERVREGSGEESQGSETSDGAAGGVEDDFDPFGNEDSDVEAQNPELDTPAARAIGWLREELELPATKSSSSSNNSFPILEMPLFWGHGVQDDRVSILLGRRGWEVLRGMDGQLATAEYETLGHWYSPEMLRDLTSRLSGSV